LKYCANAQFVFFVLVRLDKRAYHAYKTKNTAPFGGRVCLCFNVENTGFEPVTSCLPGKRSSQLS
jgi:hypothetical protein